MEKSTLKVNRATMGKRMVQGAATGLMLISYFIFGIDNPDPDWPTLWRIKPLFMAPLAGATGGLLYYFINPLSHNPGWKRTGANLLALLVFLLVLWLGTVLGLNGTMWN